MKTYVTFGQVHRHRIGDTVFDADCVAVIEAEDYSEGRDRAFELFGPRFCTTYTEESFTDDMLKYYPRGLIAVAEPSFISQEDISAGGV